MNKLIFSLIACMYTITLLGQDVTFGFTNSQIITQGPDVFYEADVIATSNVPFKLGSGQIYVNYNSSAFGTSVFASGSLNITNVGLALTATFDVYSSFVINDNTLNRFSYSWQQALSSGCFVENITIAPNILFHIQLRFLPGQSGLDPMICFESTSIFDDQTLTACGPEGSCNLSDCAGTPGIQIINDNFDCTGALLPVTLYSFLAEPHSPTDAMVSWKTATEENSDFFNIERSSDGEDWIQVGTQPAAGNSLVLKDYHFLDKKVFNFSKPITTFYYRLKMVDLDGTYEYSHVEAVTFNGESINNYLDVQLFPNPAVKEVNILVHQVEQPITEIRIKDITGRVVSKTDTYLESGDSKLLNLTQERLGSGIFFLDFRSDTQRITSKKLIITE